MRHVTWMALVVVMACDGVVVEPLPPARIPVTVPLPPAAPDTIGGNEFNAEGLGDYWVVHANTRMELVDGSVHIVRADSATGLRAGAVYMVKEAHAAPLDEWEVTARIRREEGGEEYSRAMVYFYGPGRTLPDRPRVVLDVFYGPLEMCDRAVWGLWYFDDAGGIHQYRDAWGCVWGVDVGDFFNVSVRRVGDAYWVKVAEITAKMVRPRAGEPPLVVELEAVDVSTWNHTEPIAVDWLRVLEHQR